jgi:gamma-glutamylputrescine oxidase
MNRPDSFSYWEQKSLWDAPDYVIVGSGIVGLTCAINLKKINPSFKINILEKGMMPEGASTRNAGFACFGSISELMDDQLHMDEDEIFELVKMRYNGLQKLIKLLGKKVINYQNLGGFEIFNKNENEDFEKFQEKIPHYNSFLEPITGSKNTYKIINNGFGMNIHSKIIKNSFEGQINTGSMMKELIQMAQKLGIKIFYGADVEMIENNHIKVNNIEMKIKDIIICTNGFARKLLPQLEVQPARNMVLVTKEIPNLKLKGCFHYQKGFYYFRNIDNRLLIGGGRNLDFTNENTDDFGINSLITNKLNDLLANIIIPEQPFDIEYQWSGILGIGNKKSPIIEKISDNITVAVRMGGMGVAIGSLVGERAAKLALS